MKRYSLEWSGAIGSLDMFENPDGDWVRYEEHVAGLADSKREVAEAERDAIWKIIASKEPPPGFAEWVADTRREAVREALKGLAGTGVTWPSHQALVNSIESELAALDSSEEG